MLGHKPNPPNDEGPETITTNTAVNGACQTLLRAAKTARRKTREKQSHKDRNFTIKQEVKPEGTNSEIKGCREVKIHIQKNRTGSSNPAASEPKLTDQSEAGILTLCPPGSQNPLS